MSLHDQEDVNDLTKSPSRSRALKIMSSFSPRKMLQSPRVKTPFLSPRKSLSRLAHFRSPHKKLLSGKGTKGKGSLKKSVLGNLLMNDLLDVDNAVYWMASECPYDVLPKILAFAGPQTAQALSQTNQQWNQILKEEGIWRMLCEELFKWKSGDEEPECWKDFYRQNPCVPVDFSTIALALVEIAGRKRSNSSTKKRRGGRQHHSVHIWIRPGVYSVTGQLHIQAVNDFTRVIIERMDIPTKRSCSDSLDSAGHIEEPKEEFVTIPEQPRDDSLNAGNEDDSTTYAEFQEARLRETTEVTLTSTLSTKTSDKPLFRVSRGQLVLRNIQLQHKAYGVNIWGGNAAIHVQPSTVSRQQENTDTTPTPETAKANVTLENCEVTSLTGRGMVVTGGGQVSMKNCYVHSCAATGIYVGGSETTHVHLSQTDIVRNGGGNTMPAGIARGHSGICLEFGTVHIQNSSVVENSTSGISLVRSSNRQLIISDTDVMQNGLLPIDQPTDVANGNRDVEAILTNSSAANNRFLPTGEARLRSTLAKASAPTKSRRTSSPNEFEIYHGR